MKWKMPVSGFFIAGAVVAAMLSSPQQSIQAAQKTAPAASQQKTSAADQDEQMRKEGERVFEQNCSRCHNPPDGFPTSISGTVVRHMRVRANLSKHDEQVLLRFFNP